MNEPKNYDKVLTSHLLFISYGKRLIVVYFVFSVVNLNEVFGYVFDYIDIRL